MEIDPDQIAASITGRTVVGVNVGDGGVDLELDDGRTLIFTGTFCVALIELSSPKMQ